MGNAVEVTQGPPPSDLLRSMVPSAEELRRPLVVNGVLPVLGYAALRPLVGSDVVALTAVLVFPVLDVVVARLGRRAVEPVAVIVLVSIGLTIIGTLIASGGPLLLKVRPSAITMTFGVGCLLSLLLPRPALFHVGRSFAMARNPRSGDAISALWHQPAIPRTLRMLTLAWGLALLAQGATNIALALLTSTGVFLVGSFVVDWAGLAALLWATTVVVRRATTASMTGPAAT